MMKVEDMNSAIPSKLFFRLYQTMNLSLRRTAEVLGEYEMTAQQWSILDLLSNENCKDGMTVNDLVKYLMVSRQSLNGVLKRMEVSGYIERVVNPDDLRSRQIRITSYGQVIRHRVAPEVTKLHSASLKHMSEDEKVSSLLLLNQIMGNIQRH